MSKENLTIAEIRKNHGLDSPVQIVSSVETILETGNFSQVEKNTILNLQNAISSARNDQFAVMFYSNMVAENSELLKKFGYGARDFGKFMHDKFGFDKGKASKYAKCGKLFIRLNGGMLETVFKSLLEKDLTPTQLQEMLISDTYIKKGFPTVEFWSNVISSIPSGKLSVACIRDYKTFIDNLVKMLPSDEDMKGFSSPLALEMKKSEIDEIQAQIRAKTTSVPETPVPETPVPETPVPETPVPETPVPETPVPETPVPETPVPVQPTFTQPTLQEVVSMLAMYKDELSAMTRDEKKNLFGELYKIIQK